MFKSLLAATMAVTLVSPAWAANVRVVPGSGVAYMYFPAEGDNRTKIKVVKKTGMGLAENYEVYYTYESEAEELLCGASEISCEKTLGAGKVKLRIDGDWAPLNSSIDLAMQAEFSDGCSTIGSSCQMTTLAGESYTVGIKAGCNGNDYSVVSLGEGAEALCIGDSLDGKNNLLLAAHKHIAAGKRPKNKKSTWGYKSDKDGAANTKIILENWSGSTEESAAHYCDTLSIGSGSGRLTDWYLPAIDELDKVLNGWVDENFIIPKPADNYYSSTESDSEKTRIIKWSNSSGKSRSTEKYKYTDGSTLCVHAVSH